MSMDHEFSAPKDVSLKTTKVYGDASIIVIQHAKRRGGGVAVSYSITHLPGVEVKVKEYQGEVKG